MQLRSITNDYAYLPPTPEVMELWRIGKALGPEYLLSPEGEAELKDESAASVLRLHVLFALASVDTINRLPRCSWIHQEASLLRQLSRQVLDCLSTHTLAEPPSSSLFPVFNPQTNLLDNSFKPRFRYASAHLPHLRHSEAARVVVENLEQFQWNFQVFSQGLLGNVSGVVSGSAVLACMYMAADKRLYDGEVQLRKTLANLVLPRELQQLVAGYAFHSDPLMPYSPALYNALFRVYHLEPEWQGSDIDVFLQVRDVSEAEAALQKIATGYQASLPAGVDFTMIRTGGSVTLCSRWPFRPVQVVLLLFPSVCGLLSCFDLDCVRLAFSLQSRTVSALPQAARAVSTGLNVVAPSLALSWNPTTVDRVKKYCLRGFSAMMFDLWPLEHTFCDWLQADSPNFNPAMRGRFSPSSILMPSYSANSPENPKTPPKSHQSPSNSSSNSSSSSGSGSCNGPANRSSNGIVGGANVVVADPFSHVNESLRANPPPYVFQPPLLSPSTVFTPPFMAPSPYGGGSFPIYGAGSPPFFLPMGAAPVFRPPVMNFAFPPRSPILNFSYKPPRLVSSPQNDLMQCGPPLSPTSPSTSQIEAHLGNLLETMSPVETVASIAHAELRRCLWLGNALRRLFRVPCDSTVTGMVFGVPHDWDHAANFGGDQLIAAWDSETRGLQYGPGVNTVEKVPEYLALLHDMDLAGLSGATLEAIHHTGAEGEAKEPPAIANRVPKDWFRWNSASELTRGVLEKNI